MTLRMTLRMTLKVPRGTRFHAFHLRQCVSFFLPFCAEIFLRGAQ